MLFRSEFWGYDNSPFLDFLRLHKFQVVTNARANYASTPECISASLNMAYPMPLPKTKIADLAPLNYLCGTIQAAEAPRRLQAAGYRLINLSLFDLCDQPRFYWYQGANQSSLAGLIFDSSAFGHLLNDLSAMTGMLKGRTNLRIFVRLVEIAAESSDAPRFVYAHLMMPHWPLAFNRYGQTLSWGEKPRQVNKENYLEHLLFANQLLTNTVATILAKSKTSPIIIIQGDHGFRLLSGQGGAREKTTILNAYHLPDATPDWSYPGITPVNTFRMVLNRYFGTGYPYLPDRQFDNQDATEKN